MVKDKLLGRPTYGAINWSGNTVPKMLRINKGEIRKIRERERFGDLSLIIRLMQISKKDRSDLSLHELTQIATSYGFYLKDLQKLLKYAALRRINAYIIRQQTKYKQHFGAYSSVLSTWKDYIHDCETLEMDLIIESVLFPKNLYQAHQHTISQIKYKADEILNKKIAERMKTLEKFRFEANGLLIRPAASSQELIDEGKALHHCVGGYASKFAEGKTMILFIRRAEAPSESFYTMEIQKENIIQCRGKNNRDPSKEVAAFIKQFQSSKLSKQAPEINICVAVPA